MRLSLHSLVLAPALLAAAALTPQTASAAVLRVPFSFTVSGQNLPAGNYTVSHDQRASCVILTSPDGKRSFEWLIAPGDALPGAQGIAMLFDPTDSGYVLRAVRYNAMTTSRLDKKAHENEDRPVHVIRGE